VPRAADDARGAGDADATADAAPGDGRLTGDAAQDLQVAAGWSIEVLVDLTAAGFVYNSSDFVDDASKPPLTNQPNYVVALYLPFTASLAVLAGRSVIEVGSDLNVTVHKFTPDTANSTGPDAFGRAAVADFGSGKAGLWVTSASDNGGDGLFLIDNHWTSAAPINNTLNNTYALAFDPDGSYDAVAGPALYVAVSSGAKRVERQTRTAQLTPVFSTSDGVDELAVVGTTLF